jgi:hypothetical protein
MKFVKDNFFYNRQMDSILISISLQIFNKLGKGR